MLRSLPGNDEQNADLPDRSESAIYAMLTQFVIAKEVRLRLTCNSPVRFLDRFYFITMTGRFFGDIAS
jgi:hypothetical protein